MTNRLLGVVWDAIKVAIAAWVAISIDPWAQKTFPTLGKPLQFLIAAIIAAVVLEVAFQIFIGWPRIHISWRDTNEDVPISEIAARIRRSNSQSQVFSLKISTPSSGWVGYQLLRLYMRRPVQLRVGIERAAVVPTRESASKVGGVPSVDSDDAAHGFTVYLGAAPRRPGPWHWADVRWRDEGTPTDDEFNIDYVLYHDKRLVRLLLNLLVRRSSNVRRFRVVGP